MQGHTGVTVTNVKDFTSGLPFIDHLCDKNRPKLIDLVKYSAKISASWKQVALNLGISEHKVDTINSDNPSIKDKCYYMFKTWLETNTSACWCQLRQALCAHDVSLQKVADEVKTHLTYVTRFAKTRHNGAY